MIHQIYNIFIFTPILARVVFNTVRFINFVINSNKTIKALLARGFYLLITSKPSVHTLANFNICRLHIMLNNPLKL